MIGDADHISVWKDPWLRDPSNYYIGSLPILGLENIRVKDLFILGHLQWDIERLGEMFNERDITEILSIPLSRRGDADCLTWHHSQKGCYLLKTGYAMAVTLSGITEDHQIHGE